MILSYLINAILLTRNDSAGMALMTISAVAAYYMITGLLAGVIALAILRSRARA